MWARVEHLAQADPSNECRGYTGLVQTTTNVKLFTPTSQQWLCWSTFKVVGMGAAFVPHRAGWPRAGQLGIDIGTHHTRCGLQMCPLRYELARMGRLGLFLALSLYVRSHWPSIAAQSCARWLPCSRRHRAGSTATFGPMTISTLGMSPNSTPHGVPELQQGLYKGQRGVDRLASSPSSTQSNSTTTPRISPHSQPISSRAAPNAIEIAHAILQHALDIGKSTLITG